MIDLFVVPKLTKKEKQLFHAITNDSTYVNFILMKVKYRNKNTSCICSINRKLNKIHPLAILVNNSMSKEILCPKGENLENE